MFTPEKEYDTNRLREVTPKTPLRRLKMDEDDLTPLSLRDADKTLGEYFDQINSAKLSVQEHLEEAIKSQKRVITIITSALSFAREYERDDEVKELQSSLSKEKMRLKSLEQNEKNSYSVF